ncbi:MAG: hypothetical protein Q7T44_01265 [Parvibaculum sp.]|nr:hypothetical protein [Parvibaculum sp.]
MPALQGLTLRLLFGLCLMFSLAACERWGTSEEAEQIYKDHTEVFHQIYEITEQDKALKNISPDYDPYGDIKFLENSDKFTDSTKAKYAEILHLMKIAELERVRVVRLEPDKSDTAEIVNFIVFARGILDNTEAIFVRRIEPAAPYRSSFIQDDNCKEVDPPYWYVCHSR